MADGIVVVALDDGGLLTVFTPVRVEATPSILRLRGSRYIEWRWIGFGSDDALTEVFESGDVEFVRSFAKGSEHLDQAR